jgi:hypothetical protein
VVLNSWPGSRWPTDLTSFHYEGHAVINNPPLDADPRRYDLGPPALPSSNRPSRGDEVIDPVREEHDALRGLYDGIEHALGSEQSATAEIREAVSRLVLDLDVHFGGEEDVNGVFDQIERDAPYLTQEVRKLRGEHAELLESAGELFVMARRGDGSALWRKQLRHLFHRLRDRLAVHEADENMLLQRAYGQDIGTKD